MCHMQDVNRQPLVLFAECLDQKKWGGWGGGGDDHDNLTDKICKSITFIPSLNSEEIFLLIVFQLQAMFVRRILL